MCLPTDYEISPHIDKYYSLCKITCIPDLSRHIAISKAGFEFYLRFMLQILLLLGNLTIMYLRENGPTYCIPWDGMRLNPLGYIIFQS
jgi:hypothetical protein